MKLALPRRRPLVVLSLRAKRDVKRRALLLMMRLRLGIRRKVELLIILRFSRRRKPSEPQVRKPREPQVRMPSEPKVRMPRKI